MIFNNFHINHWLNNRIIELIGYLDIDKYAAMYGRED